MGTLIRILFRPSSTLDRLLEERRTLASWRVTCLLIVAILVVPFLSGVFLIHDLLMYALDQGWYEFMYSPADYNAYASLFGWTAVAFAAGVVLSRLLFGWIVQLGLRVSASKQLPRTWRERLELAGQLRLIQPYTLWLLVLPSLLSTLLMPLLLDPEFLLGSSADVNGDPTSATSPLAVLKFLIWVFASLLLLLGGFVWMVIVRVLAIRKIYRISGARAFWGPCLIYAVLYFLLFAAWMAWVIFVSTFNPVGPSENPILWL